MVWPFTRRDSAPEPVAAAASPVVAAAVPYRGSPTGQRADTGGVTPRKPRDWQSEAYDFYDLVWLVKKGLNLRADMVSRVMLYVGYRVSDEEERPVEVMEEATRKVEPDDEGNPGRPNALTVAQAATAVFELDRMQATQGGQAAILHDLDLNLNIAGECSLVAYPLDPPSVADEEWLVLSVDEFRKSQVRAPDGTARYERLGPSGRWEPMHAETFAHRVWRPHPRRTWEPDSPMRAILENCKTLNVSERMVRSQLRHRTGAGIQYFPNEALDSTLIPEGKGMESHPVILDMEGAWLDPPADEGSAAAVAPVIVPMDAGLIPAAVEGFKTLDRPMDKVAVLLRAEARDAIAGGLPLPPELTQGLGDSNHWSAAQITDNGYRQHFEPGVREICESLTALFRPAWLAAGVPREVVQRLVVAADPSGLIVAPDRMDNSKQAFEEILITRDRRRRDLGYAEADAPSDEEKAEEVALRQALNSSAPLPLPDATDDGTAPASEPIVATAQAIVAAVSGRQRALASLAKKLASIDRLLFTELRAAADVELEAALTRAGNRILSRLSRGQRGAPFPDGAEAVAASLGPEKVAELGLTDDELLSRSFYGLRDRYLTLTREAHRKALRAAASVTGLSPQDVERAVDDAEPQREAGLDVFLTALLALARERIYDPHPASPPLGEHDTAMRVPASLVRQSLAIAGGEADPVLTEAGGVLTAQGLPVGGVANGPDVAAIFAASNVITTGYVWEHGDPAVPFEPHADLDGQEFETWSDPILAVPDGEEWLDIEFMRPGDHLRCQCNWYRQLADNAAEDESEAA